MGFAIPTQIVEPTVETLIRDGKVSHGLIGIGISDVTPDNAKFFQMSNANGAVVTEVEPNSAGGKAGLHIGDVITKLNGQPVTDAGELQMEVGQKRPGETIQLEVMREGKTMNVPVTLEAMGATNGGATVAGDHEKGRWGLSLGDLSPDARDQMQIPSTVHGAVVQDVQPGSPADNAGLQRGDVIVEVDRHSEQSAADVAKALADVAEGAGCVSAGLVKRGQYVPCIASHARLICALVLRSGVCRGGVHPAVLGRTGLLRRMDSENLNGDDRYGSLAWFRSCVEIRGSPTSPFLDSFVLRSAIARQVLIQSSRHCCMRVGGVRHRLFSRCPLR